MESPIQLPNTQQLAVGTAQNLLFRFSQAKPFRVKDQDKPDFKSVEELTGTSWITSLELKHHDAEIGSFVFEECIITVNLEKNIISTALQGRDGTIKEYVAQGDYTIGIAAGITNYKEGDLSAASKAYPTDQIKRLNKFLKIKESLTVTSDFLAYFGINSAVIQKFSLTQETHSNRQSISITMLSDTTYEILLKEKQDVKTVQ
ncbi:DUF6046 domain-containing protein [Pedobacter cryoconitis]|uniref:DUF6046 domain-containing protein n=1 Tax=Pedobacter cryoconitis TaxID=188932 RepID=A0A7X0MJ10_9SPHI|nr:DUF6046 domain-containing protein [Pedobacter cryoconitis]MBB6499115.1 hypothetical protein [Pedobacter cryoconitis]